MTQHTLSSDLLVQLMADMKASVEGLVKSYGALAPVIEAEHKALKTGKISDLEETQQIKISLGKNIEDHFNALQKASAKIDMQYNSFLGQDRFQQASSLSQSIRHIKKIRRECFNNNFASQVIDHQISGLEKLLGEFSSLRDRIQPSIEQNKIVLQKTLQNYQESFRFWKEIEAELMASYNACGLQKSSESSSILNVKA